MVVLPGRNLGAGVVALQETRRRPVLAHRHLSAVVERARGGSERDAAAEDWKLELGLQDAANGSPMSISTIHGIQEREEKRTVRTKKALATWISRWVAAAAVLVGLMAPGAAQAQAIIKVNDDVNIKFGLLLQGWADWNQDTVTSGYIQNLFLRRARFIVGGQVAKNVTFFFETDNPNLGKAPKALGTGLIVQDAYLEWKIADAFILDGGLILIPMSRNGLQSAASQLSLDYGTFTFLNSGPTQSSVGRDTGFQLKGYLVDKHLEYRIGAFEGFRNPAVAGFDGGSRNSFRSAGRLQYNFLDAEVGPFYAGTYLGKKKVLSVGVGYDTQSYYNAYSGDVFFELPAGKAGAVTGQFDWVHWDGEKTFTALSQQNDWFGELGFFFAGAKTQPYVKYEKQAFAVSDDTKGQKRFQVGLNYYIAGQNLKLTGAYTKIMPNNPATSSTNQFTVQLQLFYF